MAIDTTRPIMYRTQDGHRTAHHSMAHNDLYVFEGTTLLIHRDVPADVTPGAIWAIIRQA